MSDTAPAVAAPGAAQAPAQSAPEGMGESQAAALKWVGENRAAFAADMNNLALQRQHREALAHAFHGGPLPAFLAPADAKPAELDTRPHDSLRDVFEEIAKPASELQIKAAVDNAVVQGVDRGLASQVAGLCSDLGLAEGHTRTVLDRVRAHYGATFESGPAKGFEILTEHEAPEWVAEASKAFGSSAKLAEVSIRAREFLQSRGLLEKYDQAGLTNSTLAFDPKLLRTLATAADRAGVPCGSQK